MRVGMFVGQVFPGPSFTWLHHSMACLAEKNVAAVKQVAMLFLILFFCGRNTKNIALPWQLSISVVKGRGSPAFPRYLFCAH